MIGYCFSREHARHMVDSFNATGITAAYLDGETPDGDRRRVIGQFAAGAIMVLFNVALFREGFDLSAQVGQDVPIQAVGLYNPTKSLPLAIQMMMRGMRPQEGSSVILDHANIIKEHGLPDDEREWPLDGERTKKGAGGGVTATTVCGSCWSTFRPTAPCCPFCGHHRDIQGRQIQVVDGELEEINPDLMRQARDEEKRAAFIAGKIEESACRTFADWAALGAKRGHKPGWARMMWKVKGSKMKAKTNA